MYKCFLKPIFDFLLSLIATFALLPFYFIIVLAIKIDSKGPILFKQKRVGKNKKIFNIYKFRTMRIDTPKDMPTHLLNNPQQYITKVGKFLRKTSLDELPQIFNILFGKMSIIGPRPALWNQEDLIAERDKYNANKIKPGLTGWAQVNGRDELSIARKAELDGEYAKKRNIFFDIKIFFMTIHKIFKSEGVIEGGTGALQKQEIDENSETELIVDDLKKAIEESVKPENGADQTLKDNEIKNAENINMTMPEENINEQITEGIEVEKNSDNGSE